MISIAVYACKKFDQHAAAGLHPFSYCKQDSANCDGE